ncbi:MAG: S1C family serine protease [Oscillospiraceae bacterium]
MVMSADGYILTNAHVVADSLRMSVLLSDGRVMEARLVGADAGEDLAVLKVEASGLTPAEFGDSDRLRCGEMVVAIGDPLGYRTSITQGIVSALNRTVPVDGVELQVIQTSAPINFGNSGGALINDRGQVVGITTLKVVAQDSTVEGLGFAIPMQKVKEVADWLIAGQPAMGFTVDFSGGSLRVAALEENSSAGRAGLQVDDVLLSLNGAPLPTIQELRRVKNTLIPGRLLP